MEARLRAALLSLKACDCFEAVCQRCLAALATASEPPPRTAINPKTTKNYWPLPWTCEQIYSDSIVIEAANGREVLTLGDAGCELSEAHRKLASLIVSTVNGQIAANDRSTEVVTTIDNMTVVVKCDTIADGKALIDRIKACLSGDAPAVDQDEYVEALRISREKWRSETARLEAELEDLGRELAAARLDAAGERGMRIEANARRHEFHRAVLRYAFERDEDSQEVNCRECGQDVASGPHGVIYVGDAPGKPCPVGVLLGGAA